MLHAEPTLGTTEIFGDIQNNKLEKGDGEEREEGIRKISKRMKKREL